MEQYVSFGNDSLINIKEHLIKYNPNNILLLTGKGSYIKSGAKDLIEPCLSSYRFYRYSDFENNPKLEDVENACEFFNTNQCDLIIAVGGGTVLDMAKLITFFARKNKPYKDYFNDTLNSDKKIPIFAIPTTAGSGSEATHFAVVYANDIKYSIADSILKPEYVFLVPKLTYNNPKYLTAVTSIDAFSQAIESWWSVNSTEESIRYSKQAVKLIWDNLLKATNKNDALARQNLMKASYLAGKAIDIAKTTGAHALSYGFTTYYNIPHGHAVSLFLPNFVKVHVNVKEENCNDKRGVNWVVNIMNEISSLLNIKLEELADVIADFINKCGLIIDFKKLNISKLDYEKALENFNKDRLGNNPVKVDNLFLTNLYDSELNKI